MIFYVDEFGDHSMFTDPTNREVLKSGVSEWFVLAGVGIRDNSRKPLAEALFDIKKKHFGPGVALEPWAASEIKGRHLRRAARSAASGNVLMKPDAYSVLDRSERVDALVADLGLVFVKYRPLVFAVAVDKAALLVKRNSAKKTAPPLGAAYAYLEQRVALTMENLFAGEAAILVADQQTQHETFFRSGELNAVRDGLTRPLPMKPNFGLVLDKPLWVDTHLSSWDREIIQLADIVAYSAAECMIRGQAPTESCYLWREIRLCMAAHWSTGQIEAGGLAIYPKPQVWPTT